MLEKDPLDHLRVEVVVLEAEHKVGVVVFLEVEQNSARLKHWKLARVIVNQRNLQDRRKGGVSV